MGWGSLFNDVDGDMVCIEEETSRMARRAN